MPHPRLAWGARLARPGGAGDGAGVDDPERRYREAKALIAAGDAAAGRGALERLAEEGHPAACCRLAEMLQAEGRPGAAALLARAAAADHPRACFLLGLLHAHGGDGLGADRAAALRWCERAARLGSAEAQFNLGLLHGEEEGGEGEAGRWLQLAAANGVAEAEACLDILWQEASDPGARPRTWDEAETRASVALARTDPDAPKSLRFAEYYVDPCLDLLARRMKLRRDQGEDIVQQFFLELEEPLSKGEHRGRPWKESLRSRFDPGRGAFRPYLSRALVNFAHDWLAARERAPGAPAREEPDLERHRREWVAMLARFQAECASPRPELARAVATVVAMAAEDAGQAVLAARHQVSERTVRRDAQAGAGLLQDWLQRRIDAAAPAAADDALLDALRRGCELVPVWLHNPSAEKRGRLLCLLALAARRLDDHTPASAD
jgi:hypothetical protein